VSLQWIRKKHGIPAYRGARIVYVDEEGYQYKGRIVCSTGQCIRVMFDGFKRALTIHPSRRIEFIAVQDARAAYERESATYPDRIAWDDLPQATRDHWIAAQVRKRNG
jgi:hypothetical protein